MTIDLRSDTVTKPTPPMLEAMMRAEVGDDVFDEDPTVKKLEEKVAELFGHEAALFCPSGTMTNQIALRINTEPQDEVICDRKSHIYNYEGGGIAYNSLISVRLLEGDRGRLSATQIKENINPDDIHFPQTSLISLENTVNKGGGCFYDLAEVKAIHQMANEHGLRMHLDGARLFNALAETGEAPDKWGKYFDTISLCLSKGLGAPVGSVLISTAVKIKKAKRVRKVFGGGMRQAGYLAAAGIYALDHHVDRLKDDHERAKALGSILEGHPLIDTVMPVDTNIVIFSVPEEVGAERFLEKLAEHGIRGVPFGKNDIRLVTHLDFDNRQLNAFEEKMKQIK